MFTIKIKTLYKGKKTTYIPIKNFFFNLYIKNKQKRAPHLALDIPSHLASMLCCPMQPSARGHGSLTECTCPTPRERRAHVLRGVHQAPMWSLADKERASCSSHRLLHQRPHSSVPSDQVPFIKYLHSPRAILFPRQGYRPRVVKLFFFLG